MNWDNLPADTLQRNKFISNSSLIIRFISQHSSATLVHQYQQGENGRPVKIEELRTFLQTNIVRSSDTDKMHFCSLLVKALQANISSLNLEQTFYRLTYSPSPLYLKKTQGHSCETVDCNLRVRDLRSRGPWFGDNQMHCVVLVSLTLYLCFVLAQSWLDFRHKLKKFDFDVKNKIKIYLKVGMRFWFVSNPSLHTCYSALPGPNSRLCTDKYIVV